VLRVRSPFLPNPFTSRSHKDGTLPHTIVPPRDGRIFAIPQVDTALPPQTVARRLKQTSLSHRIRRESLLALGARSFRRRPLHLPALERHPCRHSGFDKPTISMVRTSDAGEIEALGRNIVGLLLVVHHGRCHDGVHMTRFCDVPQHLIPFAFRQSTRTNNRRPGTPI
jgi:hypothetical protein